jgi:hypothetical protein
MGENALPQWPTPGKRGTIVSSPLLVKPLCQRRALKFSCSAKQKDWLVTLSSSQRAGFLGELRQRHP